MGTVVVFFEGTEELIKYIIKESTLKMYSLCFFKVRILRMYQKGHMSICRF